MKKLLIVFVLLFTYSFAMTKEQIKPEMSNKIDKVLMILKDSKLAKDQKGKEIIQIMNSLFDYPLMAKLSLGKNWKIITKDQREKFTTLFEQKLKDSYIEKLDLYTDELVEILDLKEPKRNRIVLKTQLIGKDDKYEIDYKFYNKKNSPEWFIYDVDLLGVSIIQTYRKQFSGFLKDKNFDELLVHMETKK